MQDFFHRGLAQLYADDKDDGSHDQAGKIFDPRMAVGMFLVRRLGCHAETQQRHDGAGGVGEVVDGIRCDGDGAGNRADQQLCREKDQVTDDPNRPAQLSVCRPNLCIFGILIVFHKQLEKQPRHKSHLKQVL